MVDAPRVNFDPKVGVAECSNCVQRAGLDLPCIH